MSKFTVNQNHYGSGHNITADIVNIGPQPCKLTDADIDNALWQIGDAQIVQVSSYGPVNEVPFQAQAFVNALVERGYTAEILDHSGSISLSIPKGICVTRNGNIAEVTFNPT